MDYKNKENIDKNINKTSTLTETAKYSNDENYTYQEQDDSELFTEEGYISEDSVLIIISKECNETMFITLNNGREGGAYITRTTRYISEENISKAMQDKKIKKFSILTLDSHKRIHIQRSEKNAPESLTYAIIARENNRKCIRLIDSRYKFGTIEREHIKEEPPTEKYSKKIRIKDHSKTQKPKKHQIGRHI